MQIKKRKSSMLSAKMGQIGPNIPSAKTGEVGPRITGIDTSKYTDSAPLVGANTAKYSPGLTAKTAEYVASERLRSARKEEAQAPRKKKKLVGEVEFGPTESVGIKKRSK